MAICRLRRSRVRQLADWKSGEIPALCRNGNVPSASWRIGKRVRSSVARIPSRKTPHTAIQRLSASGQSFLFFNYAKELPRSHSARHTCCHFRIRIYTFCPTCDRSIPCFHSIDDPASNIITHITFDRTSPPRSHIYGPIRTNGGPSNARDTRPRLHRSCVGS